MAWCGWLWLCPLSLTDHHMMNHTPTESKSTHTHTFVNTHSSQALQSWVHLKPSQEESQLSSSLVVCPDINFNKPAEFAPAAPRKIHQGAKGRREEAEPQPYAVRVSLLLCLWFVPSARSDSCPTDSSAHAPVGLLEQLNERLHVRIWTKARTKTTRKQIQADRRQSETSPSLFCNFAAFYRHLSSHWDHCPLLQSKGTLPISITEWYKSWEFKDISKKNWKFAWLLPLFYLSSGWVWALSVFNNNKKET